MLAEKIIERYGFDTGGDVPADGGLAAVLGRATQRRFRLDPVADVMLKALLACAQSAPSKSDLQQYSIIVVQDSEMRRAIAELCHAGRQIDEAPEFLVFCADMCRGQKITELRGHPHANNNMDTFLNAVVDTALAMQDFIQSAESVGLGCCPISALRNPIGAISELLVLPPGVFPIAGLCLGWPAEPAAVSMRLPPSVVVHWDRYDDGNLGDEIDAYDQRRHERRPIPLSQQRDVERHGEAAFYGWSENAARQLSHPERAGFREFLKGHGFDLA